MKKSCIFIIVNLIFFKTFATNFSIEIYYNSNQCSNCNIGLNGLKNLSESIYKKIYFSTSDKEIVNEILEPTGISKGVNIEFYSEKESPFNIINSKSFCLIFENNLKVDSFELNDLLSKINFLNLISNQKIQSHQTNTILNLKSIIPWSDSLKLSNNFICSINKNQIVIIDNKLNKTLYFLLDEKFVKTTKSFVINAKDFNTKQFLKLGTIDTLLYKFLLPELKNYGKTKPSINQAFLTDSTLNLLLVFPCGVI